MATSLIKKIMKSEKYCMLFSLLLASLFFFMMAFFHQHFLSQQYPNIVISDDHIHSWDSKFHFPLNQVRVEDDVYIAPTDKMCTYWNCINSYKCTDDGLGKIGVYIYDLAEYVDKETQAMLPPPSKEYIHMLWTISISKYNVQDPEKACILIPSIDLLNREKFSGDNAAKVLSALPFWNNGTNHLLFNIIPGIGPDFLSTLDFAHGKAMLTGSGFTQRSYRRTFDIAIPYFNPYQEDKDSHNYDNRYRTIFLLASQRQFYSDVYNLLTSHKSFTSRFDVVVFTTCASVPSAGMNRCDTRGHQHSYPSVLSTSKFCLISRERQFATINLHNILRAGCIPVISLDTYVMPFSDVLDWKRAAVFVNENRLDELVTILSNILDDGNTYNQLVDQGRFYYKTYFQDVSKIALTTLDIINERALSHRSKTYEQWNRAMMPNVPRLPIFIPLRPSQKQGFTAVVLTYDRFELMKLVVINVAKAKNVAKIIVIWNNPKTKPPGDSHWPAVSVPLKVIRSKYNRLSNRFYPYNEIETDCVLTIDDDIIMVTPAELNFGYRVWSENVDRLVGFPPRYHSLSHTDLIYQSEWMSNISMILTGVAFYHKYYHYLFTSSLPGNIKHWVDENMNCEDIAMNFLIANVTGKAPIKILARKKFTTAAAGLSSSIASHLVARNTCLKVFTEAFGTMPLRSVEFRADPLLYKQEGITHDMELYPSNGEL